MSAKLYEIATGIMAALTETDDTGELCPGAEERLNQLQCDLETKADNICRYVQQCQADAQSYKSEAARLSALASSAANKAERLKKYLKETLQNAGIGKLTTELFALTVAKNSQPSVTIEEGYESKLPLRWQRVTIAVDKKAILDDYKNGATLPEEVVVRQDFHLRIR